MDILAQIVLFFAILAFVANLLIVTLSSYELKTAIQRRLKIDPSGKNAKKSLFSTILDLFVPVNYMLVNKFFKRDKLEARLYAARVFIMPEHFLAMKQMMLFLFLFLTFMFVQSGDIMPLVVLPFVGFLSPDLWLGLKIKKRNLMN